jgi:hypothetical protein
MATPEYYCTPELEELSIINCPNISLPALKEMLETRCHDARNWLTAIKISGCLPEMSLEDAEWFYDRLFAFTYNRVL